MQSVPQRLFAALFAIVASLPAQSALAQTCEPRFADGLYYGEMVGTAYTTAIFDDGTGPALYMGGALREVAGDPAISNIAKRVNGEWVGVGGGLPTTVHALAVFDDGNGPALYAACADQLRRWNGQQWSDPLASYPPLSPGLPAVAMCVHDDGTGPALFIGTVQIRSVEAPPSSPIFGLARFRNGSLSQVGPALGMSGGGSQVRAMAVFNDGRGSRLYIGGSFTSFCGVTCSGMVTWTGASIDRIDPRLTGEVYTLAIHDDGAGSALYAGGALNTQSRHSGPCGVAKLVGQVWVDTGVRDVSSTSYLGCSTLCSLNDGSGPALYAAIGGAAERAATIKRFRDGAWTTVIDASRQGSNRHANCLFPSDEHPGELVLGGDFPAPAIHLVNGAFQPYMRQGLGLPTRPVSLVCAGDGETGEVIATDVSLAAGNGGLSRFTGSGWVAVTGASSLSNPTWVRNGSGGSLFASAGGVYRRDGVQWQRLPALPGSPTPTVKSLFACGDTDQMLYAVLNISLGSYSARIVRWGELGWEELPGVFRGTGLGQTIAGIVEYDDGSGPAIFVGGSFTQIDGVPVHPLVRLRGTSWEDVGTPLQFPNLFNGLVNALCIHTDTVGTSLFVGGSFTHLGTEQVNGFARFDSRGLTRPGAIPFPLFTTSGAAVLAMVPFMDGRDKSLVVALYALGVPTTDGGTTRFLSRWTGAGWQSISGVTSSPSLLAVSNNGSSSSLWTVGPAHGDYTLSFDRLDGCPRTCPADLDDGSGTGTRDGGVSLDDLFYFLTAYELGDARADIDDGSNTNTLDGGVGIEDLLYFVRRFEGGC
jgi:hypothetical protein